MTAIGSLVFCTDCGNLLEANTSRKTHLTCDVCGAQNKDTSSKSISTHSKPDAFPSSLRNRLRTDVQEIAEGDIQTDVLIDNPCEKCGNPQTLYHTKQIRSADEGSTVFYTCPRAECGWKWNENN